MKSRRGIVLLSCLGVLLMGALARFSNTDEQPDESSQLVVVDIEADEPSVVRLEQVIPPRSSLQEVLLEMDFTPAAIHDLVQQVRPTYNLNRVRSGHRVAVERSAEGVFRSLEYEIDDENYLLIEDEGEGYTPSLRQRELEVVVAQLYGEIDQSLWSTLVSQGETPQLVQSLHEILQWDVDFTAMWPGDSFRVLLERKYLDGAFVKYGDVFAVEFVSGGQTSSAFQFENPENGKKAYYDREGQAVRKAFLKVPFNFDPRITSSFSQSRYHPILKTRRPHLGVDYGAPTGTPVLASAGGRVVFAGRSGGFGNLIKIQHPNGYVTGYAHLSRIEVRRGERVEQGQQIGRVGATGLATGPHLDYRIQDAGGRFLNPRRMTSLPSDKGLEGRSLSAFLNVREQLAARLAAIRKDEKSQDQAAQAD